MANKWNYNLSSRKDMEVEKNLIPKADFSSSVMHVSEKSFFEKLGGKIKSFNLKDFLKVNGKYALFLLPLIAALVLVNKLQQRQSLESTAALGTAKLFFQTDKAILPPDTDFQLLASSSGPVGFVKTEINFDITKVKLLSEINIANSPLKRVIKITSMAEANNTGKIEIVLGLEPSSRNSAPTGSFQVAGFRLGSNTATVNAATTLTINTSNSQVVNTDVTLFNVSIINTSLTLNYIAPTTSPTTVATATPLSTVVPVATSTPNVSTSAPTINITSPSDGQTLTKNNNAFSATASDSTGIAKIELFINGNLFKTCSNQTTCSEGMKPGNLSNGTHTLTATATNKIGLTNSHTITITKK